MTNRKHWGLLVLMCSLFLTASAQEKRWEYFVNLRDYLTPFWSADTIFDEATQPIKKGKGLAEAKLLFEPKKILSVKNTYLDKRYTEKQDWRYKKGKMTFPMHSSIPFFTLGELYFKNKIEGLSMESKTPDHFVLWNETGLLQSKQILVTYIRKKSSQWLGPVHTMAKTELSGTLQKLKNKEPVKIVFYGNSIEAGGNSSGMLDQPPFLLTWPEMIVYNLHDFYGGEIVFKNQSKGGMLADWGLENVGNRVNVEKPELVVIGFGMNDGSFKVSPEKFTKEVQGIMDQVRDENPNCEFIVVTPMLANPRAIQSQIQEEYRDPLLKLKGAGVAIADMTATHRELLRHKSYQDMTGNNVNHTNDYLARWYAQVISALLLPTN